jgi:hypothetical protein
MRPAHPDTYGGNPIVRYVCREGERTMKKTVWISFDLGVSGDYEGLYAWLDTHAAKECGDSVAVIEYQPRADVIAELKSEIGEAVELNKKSRIYAIYKSEDGKMKGSFVYGTRKQAPWTGYGASAEESSDESSS